MAKTKLYTTSMALLGHGFKMASLVVTCMLSSNLWRAKSLRSGQVYHIHNFTKGSLLQLPV